MKRGRGRQTVGRGPFPSSSPRIQLSIFLHDVIGVSLSLHLHLHLLPRSILPGLSASRTHMLTRPPICTYTCAASQYMMHPGGDGRIHINLEVPNCFEVSSKRMQPDRLLGGGRSEKVLSHHLSWVFFFFNFTFVALRNAEKERRNAYLI